MLHNSLLLGLLVLNLIDVDTVWFLLGCCANACRLSFHCWLFFASLFLVLKSFVAYA